MGLLLVLALCGYLFFYGLNAGELYRTENLRALVAVEFLQGGNWVVPTLYGEPLLTKPPGMYAAIALVSWLAGGVSAWTARLPSALAASLTVLLFYRHFSRQVGRLGGLVAALLLPASALWLTHAPSADIDMLQTAWVCAALLCFLRALESVESRPHVIASPVAGFHYRVSAAGQILEQSRFAAAARSGPFREMSWWLAALLCVAGGFLTKWTAPAFFYGTVVPLLWWRGRLRVLFHGSHLLSVLLAAGICAAWMAAAVAQVGWSAFQETVSREALLRLLPGWPEPYDWAKALTHPFLILAANLPWSLAALVALRPGFAQLWDGRGRRLLQALHCWAWPNLVFWTFVPERAVRHSFPLCPGLAGLAALVWLAWLTGRLHWPLPRLTPAKALAATLALWLVVKLVYVEVGVPLRSQNRQHQPKGELLAAQVPEGKMLYVFGLKDKEEGTLFYYRRPVRRLPDPSDLPYTGQPHYCLLNGPEWYLWPVSRPAEIVLEWHDENGVATLLIRVGVAPSAWQPRAVPRSLLDGPARDERSDVTTFEAAVDVHDDDVGRTAVEHRQQRRHAGEGRAVADACRHGHDGTVDQPADNAGQSPVHAGHDDNGIGPAKLGPVAQETVDAGDADIGEQRRLAPQRAGGDDGFLRDGQVAGASCQDDDPPGGGRGRAGR
jgi:4-amino-4-deoxy-L-arabinose transferase-like glycosyltransferase